MDFQDYTRTVEKAGASLQSRSSTEEEVESLLGDSLPRILRERHEQHNGNVSAVLDDLNKSLSEAGREEDLSRGTVYNWLRKYRLRRD